MNKEEPIETTVGQVLQSVHTISNLLHQDRMMREAMQEFVDRCEKGEVRFTYTYNKFKELLK